MARLNLKDASLLDASGELAEPARRKLAIRIIDDPEARRTYEAAQTDFAVLEVLPIPEPSANERRLIPAMIKKAVRLALLEKEAAASGAADSLRRRSRRLTRIAVEALALAACVAAALTLTLASRVQDARQLDQIARINAVIDHVTMGSQSSPLQTDPEEGDMTAASWPLCSETPALSFLRDSDRGFFHNPLNADSEAQRESPDPSSPPG